MKTPQLIQDPAAYLDSNAFNCWFLSPNVVYRDLPAMVEGEVKTVRFHRAFWVCGMDGKLVERQSRFEIL